MPFYETDLDLNKRFSAMNDRLKVEFRSEFYNIFNHTNLYLPGGSGGGTASGTRINNGVYTSAYRRQRRHHDRNL